MEIKKYVEQISLHNKKEVEKIKLIAFFVYMTTKRNVFSFDEVAEKLEEVGCTISNKTRAKGYIKSSKDFKKSGQDYMLVPKIRNELQNEYSCLFTNNEEIESSSYIVDENKFLGKRTNLDKWIKQINHCYEHNCYDACAVLIRKLFETLLIMSYEKLGISAQIKDSNGDYFMLEAIVSNAKSNITLNLSREPKKKLDTIRNAGNYAAHNIYYNATKKDIDDITTPFRLIIEELYYKAGIIK